MSRHPRRRLPRAIPTCLLVTAVAAALAAHPVPARTLAAAAASTPARPVVLPDGRLLTPEGQRHDLGDFPIGLAVSPQGRLAVAANAGQGIGNNFGFGTFCDDLGKPNQCGQAPPRLVGDPATPTPDESLSVTDLASGTTSTVTVVPTSHDPVHPRFNFFSGFVAFNPAGSHLYATGGGNDALYDFPVAGATLGTPRAATLPSTLSGQPPLPFVGPTAGFTRGLAVTPDGATVLVLKEFDDELDVVDAATLTVRQRLPLGVTTPVGGSYPYAVAVSPAGDRAWVSLEGDDRIAVVALGPAGAAVTGSVAVGSHPTGLALTPDGRELLVADAGDDTLQVVATATGRVAQRLTLAALPGQRVGSVPNAVTTSRDGRAAYVALGGDNAVAALRATPRGWRFEGNVPTGWYPTAVALSPRDGQLLTVAAKGLGSRYPAGGPYPQPQVGGPAAIPTSYYYDGNNMPGLLTSLAPPHGGALARDTLTVARNLAFATSSDRRSPHNPVPARVGGHSPIDHVVYIVRENRTFDQVFGDLGSTRHDVDADPNLQMLAPATPNAHTLAGRYAISDRFFSDGEASIQGHWWTSSANANDYIEKSWRQYYSPRNHPQDPIAQVATPKGCSLFQDAQATADASHGAFSYRDYGELVGITALTTTPTLALEPLRGCQAVDPANIDPVYQSQLIPLSFDDRIRAKEFLDDVGLDASGQQVGDPATHFLRNLSYLILPEDHTTGIAGPDTPRAEVAQNDNALGTIISALSKSRYWPTTAVFVIEDDSQDGVDHIDGHRNILLLASPYAKHLAADRSAPGYVGHRHADQAGVMRTIELLLGLQPLSAYDQLASPLYDLFQDKDTRARLSPADLAPFEVAPPPPFIDEPVSALGTAKVASLRASGGALDLGGIDRAGPGLERVLWQSLRADPVPAELRPRPGIAQPTPDDD